MKVLVTGATGFVGSRLVPGLRAADHDVVALTRSPADYDAPPGVDVVGGDLLAADPTDDSAAARAATESLVEALDVDAAYYLVHSMGGSGDFAEQDRRAAANFAAAANAAETPRVVYLGGLGDEDDDLSEHLKSRREVERILAGGNYELTTLRAGVILGEGGASFEVVRQLAARLPVMVTPRWVDTACQPIGVADVVACLAGVLDHPETAGETYELGGPEELTYGELLRRTRSQLGHGLVVLPVPVLTPRLSAYWLRLMTDVPQGVARPLVEGLRNPVLARDDRIFDVLDVERTPVDVALARAIAASRDELREDPGGDPPLGTDEEPPSAPGTTDAEQAADRGAAGDGGDA